MERAIHSYLMLFNHWQLCKLLMHSSSQMLTQVNTVTVLSKQMFNNLLFAAQQCTHYICGFFCFFFFSIVKTYLRGSTKLQTREFSNKIDTPSFPLSIIFPRFQRLQLEKENKKRKKIKKYRICFTSLSFLCLFSLFIPSNVKSSHIYARSASFCYGKARTTSIQEFSEE